MNAALIDLHVRAGTSDPTPVDQIANAARERGLDGVLVVGDDAPPALAEADANGVGIYQAVELDTEYGRLLCVPSEVDEWFTGAGWKALAREGEAVPYEGAAVVASFTERGGAVVVAQPYDRDLDHVCREDAFIGAEGLAAVVVTASPRHTTSNERAVAAAASAKLPGAGGSACAIDGPRFGTVATLFPRRPQGQRALAKGLLAGRFWPVEITSGPRKPSEANAEADTKADGDKKADRKAEKRDKRGKKGKKGKEDNRGNRLDLNKLVAPKGNPFDERQPNVDPIAKLYGHADRPRQVNSGKSPEELDRINGNRAKGPDTNVMVNPDFRELRAERQHVNLLLQTIDSQRQADRDSIALRFAVSALGRDANDADIDFDALEVDDGRRKKKRRRRRR